MKKTIYSYLNPRPMIKAPEMGPSITLPDQNMSMRTLMDRYRRGMPLDVKMRQPQYHDGEFPDLTKMDLSEVENLRKYAAQEVQQLKQKLQEQEEQKRLSKEQAMQSELQQLREQLKQKQAAELP